MNEWLCCTCFHKADSCTAHAHAEGAQTHAVGSWLKACPRLPGRPMIVDRSNITSAIREDNEDIDAGSVPCTTSQVNHTAKYSTGYDHIQTT